MSLLTRLLKKVSEINKPTCRQCKYYKTTLCSVMEYRAGWMNHQMYVIRNFQQCEIFTENDVFTCIDCEHHRTFECPSYFDFPLFYHQICDTFSEKKWEE